MCETVGQKSTNVEERGCPKDNMSMGFNMAASKHNAKKMRISKPIRGKTIATTASLMFFHPNASSSTSLCTSMACS